MRFAVRMKERERAVERGVMGFLRKYDGEVRKVVKMDWGGTTKCIWALHYDEFYGWTRTAEQGIKRITSCCAVKIVRGLPLKGAHIPGGRVKTPNINKKKLVVRSCVDVQRVSVFLQKRAL